MSSPSRRAVLLLALSLALFNVYRLVHLLPGDLLRSAVVLFATVAGLASLGLGVYLLYRDRRSS